MKLYYAPASPFVRKVNIFAMEVGLNEQIEWIKTNPWQSEEILTTDNPLSKIPTLLTDDGQVLFDSRVICEYLDSLHSGNKLIPESGEARWPVLRLQALADGILDSGILRLMEGKRSPEQQSADWDHMQKNAIERGLDYLESGLSEWKDKFDIGVISVACALGWLDFRFPVEDWRKNRPQLKSWFESISQRPSLAETLPADI